MSAPALVHRLQRYGVALSLEGDRIIADGPDSVLTDETIDAIRQLKPQIRRLLQSERLKGLDASDWRAHFDERARIAEFDGAQSRAEAEALAFECCIVEWLNRHPERSNPGRCAWCGELDRDGHAVVPFGTESHSWLHPECWSAWNQERHRKAVSALKGFEITE